MAEMHPLIADGVYPIRGWSSWMALWRGTPLAEYRHSLLHFGFEVEDEGREYAERILFYLSIADGTRNGSSHFEDMRAEGVYVPHFSSFGERKSIGDVRKAVADKAYQVLCEELFRNKQEKTHSLPSWFQAIQNPEVFRAILDFLKPEKNNVSTRPDDDSRRTDIMRTFVRDFIRLGWRDFDYDDRVPQASIDLFVSARPEFAVIMEHHRLLDLFFSRSFFPDRVREEKFDRACLRVLKQLAMRPMHFPRESGKRKPVSLQEAAAFGSAAADAVLRIQNRDAEIERLAEKRKLEAQLERTKRELERHGTSV